MKLPSKLSSPAILVCKLAVLPTLCNFILFRNGVPSSSSSSCTSRSLFTSSFPAFCALLPLADFVVLPCRGFSPFLRFFLSTFFRTLPVLLSSSSSSLLTPRDPLTGVFPLLPMGDPCDPFAFARAAFLAAPRPPIPRHFSKC